MRSCSGVQLCDPMGCSPPGSLVHGIFQARILEWVAISFSRWSSRPRDRTWVSHIVGRCFTVWATRDAEPWWTATNFPKKKNNQGSLKCAENTNKQAVSTGWFKEHWACYLNIKKNRDMVRKRIKETPLKWILRKSESQSDSRRIGRIYDIGFFF